MWRIVVALAILWCPHALAEACHPATWLRLSGDLPQPAAFQEILAEMSAREVVLLGELHSEADHHRWQLQMLAALHARRPDMVIGFEMFPRRAQPALDRWVAGELDAQQFLAESRWSESWNMPAELYLPLFEFARLNRVPMLALNVERTLTRAVGEKGWDAVPEASREGVSKFAPAPPAYRDALRRVWQEHKTGSEFERFVEAQLTWDRAMAEPLAAHSGAPRRPLVVAIMGAGHVRDGHGVPLQLRALGVRSIGTLVPLGARSECAEAKPGLADAAYLLPEQPARKPAPPRLGVRLEQKGEAVHITEVTPGSLAERTGLRAGDIVTSVAGKPVRRSGELVEALRRQPEGTWLPVQVKRGDDPREFVIRFPPSVEPRVSLDIDLDPASRRLAGIAEIPLPAGELRFSLHESLSVTSTNAGQATKNGHEWRVVLPSSGVLKVEFGGTLPPLDPGIDHRGVLKALPPMASTGGSYLPAGSGWHPAPAGAYRYTVRLKLPEGQKGLVPGRLVSEESGGGQYRASFEHAAPAEGIDLMAGPYEVREKVREGVRYRTYFYRDLAPLAEGYLDDSARYVESFGKSIERYPYSEFSVVAAPLPSGFGMPTLTYLGASVLKLPFIRATSLGHEVLHNWWGNGVRVDYARGNWSEGLTTFMADYAFRERESAAAAREMRLGWLRDLAAVSGQAPLAGFRSRAHGADAAVGYGKSAMVFLMLRDAIGEAAFAHGIRAFWDQNRFAAASWEDLRAAFERASGRKLEAFFSQWLERPGAPAPRIASARLAGGNLLLEIHQRDPAYELRIPVELAYPDRTETRLVEIRGEKETAALKVDGEPRSVRLDPQARVYRLLERDELPPILRQWFTSPAPTVAILSPPLRAAGEALATRLFERPARIADAPADGALVIGLHADVDKALARPPAVAGKGTAQVWTVGGLAVISVRDAAALDALARPLPHYGSQSWLVFDGARATERGVWPIAARAVPVVR
jgi:uncharacterized iron-regulated protein